MPNEIVETTFNEYQPEPLLRPIWKYLKWTEIALTLATITAVVCQVIVLNWRMTFDILWWTLPAFVAAYGALRPKSTPMGRSLATLFLLVLAAGFWVAQSPHLFPALGREADPRDALDPVAKQLPAASRRILAWCIGVDSIFLLIFMGYFTCYSSLRDRREGKPPMMAAWISYFGLLVLWVIPALAGLGVIIASFFEK